MGVRSGWAGGALVHPEIDKNCGHPSNIWPYWLNDCFVALSYFAEGHVVVGRPSCGWRARHKNRKLEFDPGTAIHTVALAAGLLGGFCLSLRSSSLYCEI
jgi:hypothetical protein